MVLCVLTNLWQGNIAIPTLHDIKSIPTYWNAGWGTKWGAGGQLSQGKWGSLSLPSLLLLSCTAKRKERKRGRENRKGESHGEEERETRDQCPLSAFQPRWKLTYICNTGIGLKTFLWPKWHWLKSSLDNPTDMGVNVQNGIHIVISVVVRFSDAVHWVASVWAEISSDFTSNSNHGGKLTWVRVASL